MSKDKSLDVICPVCSAWKDKPCKHTKGSKKGKKRSESHPDRVRLAKVKLSEKDRERIDRVTKDYDKPKSKSNPKEKLTDEEKKVVEILSDKIIALGRNAEFIGPVTKGPLISTYRFFPVKHTKVAHIEAMNKDFAVALGSDETILAKRMPGESAVGIFVPHKKREKVLFQDTVQDVKDFMEKKTDDGHKPIPLNFGVTSNGDPFVDDLTVQPHLLVAGTTGGGKSTFLHGLVQSMIMNLSPKELKLLISDTKGVEFKAFKDIPHLLQPIAVNEFQTMEALQKCVDETERRLRDFNFKDVRNIHQYNEKVPAHERYPYIVIVIDEIFDILGKPDRNEAKANAKKLEEIVGRSRAAGIHCVASTQRPSVSLIKGQIKANFSSRVSFRLPSHQDSRTVLNTKGAENLMSKGDMLYSSSNSPELKRLHAPYTSLEDTRDIVEHVIRREKEEELKRQPLTSNPQSVAAVKLQ
jgi:DNA segregation ATPase FtsK/SpoIIIE, S-DNA-T family